MELRERIRKARKARGLTQKALAEILNVREETVLRWEKPPPAKPVNIPKSRLQGIAEALFLPEHLLTDEGYSIEEWEKAVQRIEALPTDSEQRPDAPFLGKARVLTAEGFVQLHSGTPIEKLYQRKFLYHNFPEFDLLALEVESGEWSPLISRRDCLLISPDGFQRHSRLFLLDIDGEAAIRVWRPFPQQGRTAIFFDGEKETELPTSQVIGSVFAVYQFNTDNLVTALLSHDTWGIERSRRAPRESKHKGYDAIRAEMGLEPRKQNNE